MKSLPYTVVFWLGVVALVLVSLIPNVSLPAFTIEVGGGVQISKEMLAHMLGCALLAWLYVKAYGLSFKGIVLILVLASASELIQYLFTVGRNIEIRDIIWNGVGVVLGMSIEKFGKFVTYMRNHEEKDQTEGRIAPKRL